MKPIEVLSHDEAANTYKVQVVTRIVKPGEYETVVKTLSKADAIKLMKDTAAQRAASLAFITEKLNTEISDINLELAAKFPNG
jgi:hypothetical protein